MRQGDIVLIGGAVAAVGGIVAFFWKDICNGMNLENCPTSWISDQVMDWIQTNDLLNPPGIISTTQTSNPVGSGGGVGGPSMPVPGFGAYGRAYQVYGRNRRGGKLWW